MWYYAEYYNFRKEIKAKMEDFNFGIIDCYMKYLHL